MLVLAMMLSMASMPVYADETIVDITSTDHVHDHEEENADQPTETPADQPEETPADQPEETPADQPEETPADQPEETPADQPEETPADQPEETPADQPEETPTEQQPVGEASPSETPVVPVEGQNPATDSEPAVDVPENTEEQNAEEQPEEKSEELDAVGKMRALIDEIMAKYVAAMLCAANPEMTEAEAFTAATETLTWEEIEELLIAMSEDEELLKAFYEDLEKVEAAKEGLNETQIRNIFRFHHNFDAFTKAAQSVFGVDIYGEVERENKEETPVATEPTPVEPEAEATATEPTPVEPEAEATATEPTPVESEAEATATEPTPVEPEAEATAAEPTPVVPEAEATATEPTPAEPETEATATEPTPVEPEETTQSEAAEEPVVIESAKEAASEELAVEPTPVEPEENTQSEAAEESTAIEPEQDATPDEGEIVVSTPVEIAPEATDNEPVQEDTPVEPATEATQIEAETASPSETTPIEAPSVESDEVAHTAALAEVQAEIDAFLIKHFGDTTDWTEDDFGNAIMGKYYEGEAFNQLQMDVERLEFIAEELLNSGVTNILEFESIAVNGEFAKFVFVWNTIMEAYESTMPIAEVSVLDGNLLFTDTLGKISLSGSTVTATAPKKTLKFKAG